MTKETTTITIDGIRYVKRWIVIAYDWEKNTWDNFLFDSFVSKRDAKKAIGKEKRFWLKEFSAAPLFVPESLPVPEKKP
jgi:hypothetical protein